MMSQRNLLLLALLLTIAGQELYSQTIANLFEHNANVAKVKVNYARGDGSTYQSDAPGAPWLLLNTSSTSTSWEAYTAFSENRDNIVRVRYTRANGISYVSNNTCINWQKESVSQDLSAARNEGISEQVAEAPSLHSNSRKLQELKRSIIENVVVEPNPSNGSSKISFNCSGRHHISVGLFDLNGVHILEIAQEYASSGVQNYKFSTSSLRPGVYSYRIVVDNILAVTGSLVVMR